jgi:hypothetical protein
MKHIRAIPVAWLGSGSCQTGLRAEYPLLLLLLYIYIYKHTHTYIYIYTHTGCPRRNVPDFGRVFLMLKYTDITQNTYIESWTVMEIMAREKCGLLAGPCTVPVSWQPYLCYVIESANASHILHIGWWRSQLCYVSAGHSRVMYSAWNTKDNYDMSASVYVVQFNGFMSPTS